MSAPLRPRLRISWARRQSSCSIFSPVDLSHGLEPRAHNHSSFVSRTALRSLTRRAEAAHIGIGGSITGIRC